LAVVQEAKAFAGYSYLRASGKGFRQGFNGCQIRRISKRLAKTPVVITVFAELPKLEQNQRPGQY
jgi:hypothetical protein